MYTFGLPVRPIDALSIQSQPERVGELTSNQHLAGPNTGITRQSREQARAQQGAGSCPACESLCLPARVSAELSTVRYCAIIFMSWLKSQKENEQLYSIYNLDQAIKIDIIVSTKEREFSFLKMERLAGKTAQ